MWTQLIINYLLEKENALLIVKSAIADIAANSGLAKAQVVDWTGAGPGLLHVHCGLVIFALSALLLRKRFGSPIPLAAVAFFAVLNELLDWLAGTSLSNIEPFWDVMNTLFWPTILFLIARRWH